MSPVRYTPYQRLVLLVPRFGIVCTNRWYSSYQLLVFPVPPHGIAGTACRNFISLYAIMNIILLPAGIIAGAVIGYLTAGRKAAALKTQVEAAGEREALLNRTADAGA